MATKKLFNIPCPASVYDKIALIIKNAEETRNAYYWHPEASASQRRNAETRRNVAPVTWKENGDIFTAEFTYRESCAHVYAKGIYYRNGEKTTLKAIHHSFDRLVRIPDADYVEQLIPLNGDDE